MVWFWIQVDDDVEFKQEDVDYLTSLLKDAERTFPILCIDYVIT